MVFRRLQRSMLILDVIYFNACLNDDYVSNSEITVIVKCYIPLE